MCMAVPSRVVAIDNGMATVEAFGATRTCSLMLLSESVEIGDYLILGVGGGFAQDIMPKETALAALSFMAEVLADGRA